MSLPNGWVPTQAWPNMFGPSIYCGLPGDEISGPVNLPLYTTGEMYFSFLLPSKQTSIQVAICAFRQGAPTAPIAVTLSSGANVLATATIPPASVPSDAPGWTSYVTLTPASSLTPGHYTLSFSSSASTPSNYYLQYMNFGQCWVDPSAYASYTPPPGVDGNKGVPVLWVLDANGSDLIIYPFGYTSSSVPPMQFVPATDMTINGIAPWLSDWPILFGPYTAGLSLTDTSTSTSLGATVLTQAGVGHGSMGLVPTQFPGPVNLIAGHAYQIDTYDSGATGAQPIAGLIRGSTVNPAKSGPGFPSYWFGGIFCADFTAYQVVDYAASHYTGPQGIGGTQQTAVRFTPSKDGNLTSVTVKLKSQANGETPTSVLQPYPPNLGGIPVYAALFSDAPSTYSAQPAGQLAIQQVDSATFGQDGALTISGFDFPILAGVDYWIVWSAPTATSTWYLQRNVTPYRFYQLFSSDGGVTWGPNGVQGPTEITWWAVTSAETIGNPFDDATGYGVSPTSLLAQPFILQAAGTVTAVYSLGGGGTLMATIYPDNGSGTAPAMGSPLGSGSFDSLFAYTYSGSPIVLTTPVPVPAQTKYWVVFSSPSSSGVSIAYYWERPTDPAVPAGYEAIVSSDGGGSWGPAHTEVATTLLRVGVQPPGTGGGIQSNSVVILVVN